MAPTPTTRQTQLSPHGAVSARTCARRLCATFPPVYCVKRGGLFPQERFVKTTADSGQPNTDTPIGTLTQCVASIAQKIK